MENKGKVLLGMSGGTDSSTAAILLREQGYEVEGVTFRFFEKGNDLTYLDDAARTAERLGIRHWVEDYREEFRERIVGYFVDGYLNGLTPMPCAVCNRTMKFRLLVELADRRGIPFVATGHYVRLADCQGRSYVVQGVDPDKDQSFFLWGLSQEVLRRLLFPLGGMLKSEVRAYALAHGFERMAVKKDSLGICFCEGDYRDFLRQEVDPQSILPGDFVDTSGKVLASHAGVPYYTVGQRRGLNVRFQHPIYVRSIDTSDRRIVLARHEEMFVEDFLIHEVVFQDEEEFFGRELICRVRYRKQQTPSRVERSIDGRSRVVLLEPLDAVAKGQSAVFYLEDRVVGGGLIV